jgi:hypothetical protein
MRLSLYTLLALLSSFFFLFYYYYHKRDGGEFVKTQHLFLFFSGQIASLYTYTIVYITFLCTPETFGAPEVYLNTSKSAWRTKKNNKTKQEVLLEDIGCINTPTSPTGVQLGGKNKTGWGRMRYYTQLNPAGFFVIFCFLLTLRLPHVVVVVPLAARPYCYLLSLSSVRECSCLFLSSWFSFLSLLFHFCCENMSHTPENFFAFFFWFFYRREVRKRRKVFTRAKKTKIRISSSWFPWRRIR